MPPSTQTSRGPTMTTCPLRKDQVVRTVCPPFHSLLSVVAVYLLGFCAVFESVSVEGVHPCQNLGPVQPCNYMERIIVAHA